MRGNLFVNLTIFEGYQTGEVVVQFYNVTVSPSSVIHIIGIIGIVVKHKLVDRLSPIHNLIDKRLTQQIAVRTFGTVGHRHSDTSYFAFVYIIGTEKQVVFSILTDNRRSPHGTIGPFHRGRIKHRRMFSPVYQIFG
ncbi:hypothetical protein SDC9_31118 [bioreactor metagenome]|uniref:Uncharacterized protein n=1 Tax=bioreactor metagenome TaxID=1076179 RepID=A0A644V1D7_9ZZZZ